MAPSKRKDLAHGSTTAVSSEDDHGARQQQEARWGRKQLKQQQRGGECSPVPPVWRAFLSVIQ